MAQLRTDVSNSLVKGTSALTTAPADAPAGGTGATAGAYDSAANRNILINAVNVCIDRIAEIEAILVANGLAPSA